MEEYEYDMALNSCWHQWVPGHICMKTIIKFKKTSNFEWYHQINDLGMMNMIRLLTELKLKMTQTTLIQHKLIDHFSTSKQLSEWLKTPFQILRKSLKLAFIYVLLGIVQLFQYKQIWNVYITMFAMARYHPRTPPP